MSMVFYSLRVGFAKMWANKRMLLIFYLANLLSAILLTLPYRSTVSHFVGHSLMGEFLAGQFDMDFLFEFVKENLVIFPVLMSMSFVVALIYWLINIFLSGGALSIFAAERGYTAKEFWGNAAKYFGRYFRLSLWGIPLFLILFSVQYVETGVEKLIFGSDPYESVSYWGDRIRVGLLSLGILLFFMIFDYARIYTVFTDIRQMHIAMWRSIRFTLSNLLRAFMLYFSIIVIGMLVLLSYAYVADMLSAPNSGIIFLLVLLQQLFMLFR
ncbi:MAG: hypothetical protein GWN62_04930, partial [Aliifodinibius sp.]|nr:hypothetical protein [Fodinibius sp.]